ncbi:MAG: helix-turn-helix domain-containing protein [Bacteriovoracaceae bacterium]|nr:helix-turn-helix domain-containing protein [Bacteriovoracaceae bacterium]
MHNYTEEIIDPILKPQCYNSSSIEESNLQRVLFYNLIWTIDDVCKFTTYKKGTIYNLVSNGNIPYRKCGKRLFFIPRDILSWLKGE